jgi:hypothetical protein
MNIHTITITAIRTSTRMGPIRAAISITTH